MRGPGFASQYFKDKNKISFKIPEDHIRFLHAGQACMLGRPSSGGQSHPMNGSMWETVSLEDLVLSLGKTSSFYGTKMSSARTAV